MPESDVKANNMYSHIKFPDYEYRPYPRMLYDAEGVGTTVLSEAEEADWYTQVALAEARAEVESAPLSADAIATVSASLGKIRAEDSPKATSGYTPAKRGA